MEFSAPSTFPSDQELTPGAERSGVYGVSGSRGGWLAAALVGRLPELTPRLGRIGCLRG
jgi:hypothetical protein